MNVLYCNGDSWTHGVEIPFTVTPNWLGHTDQYYGSWPWHLSEILNMVCVNGAKGGSSNDRIFRKTTDFIYEYLGKGKDPSKLTIVIGWTTPERTEAFYEDCYFPITIQEFKTKTNHKNVDAVMNEFRTAYYRIYDNDAGMKKHLKYMINLRLLCKNLGITYYDFSAIGSDMTAYNKLAVETYNLPLDNILYDRTWGYHCHENKTEMYPHGHPVIDAHKEWAQILSKGIL